MLWQIRNEGGDKCRECGATELLLAGTSSAPLERSLADSIAKSLDLSYLVRSGVNSMFYAAQAILDTASFGLRDLHPEPVGWWRWRGRRRWRRLVAAHNKLFDTALHDMLVERDQVLRDVLTLARKRVVDARVDLAQTVALYAHDLQQETIKL